MAYARPIRDILPGQEWIDRGDGSIARIVSAGNAYVAILRERIEILYEGLFRQRFARPVRAAPELGAFTVDEHRSIKRQFWMSLANLERASIYWIPSTRRITARSLAGPKPRSVPREALLVGTYEHPFNIDDFLGDLHDVLAKLDRATSGTAALAR